MSSLDGYRNQAKLLTRWHRERNYSVGGRVRQVERYRTLTDAEVLDMAMPLALAQEIVALEAGFASWPELRTALSVAPAPARPPVEPRLIGVAPILFVRDVRSATAWYGRLGFATDFLHGNPPFYGSVSRDGVCLHLRLVDRPNFAELADRQVSLILATIEVTDVKALFDELRGHDVDIIQRLVRQAWGGLDFQVRDPDGNRISFVQHL